MYRDRDFPSVVESFVVQDSSLLANPGYLGRGRGAEGALSPSSVKRFSPLALQSDLKPSEASSQLAANPLSRA